jgi:uncharacterized protein (TIGR03086 family)
VAGFGAQSAGMDTTFSTPAPFALDTDPRCLFSAAVRTGTDVVAAIRPDQLGNPSPCPGFDVRGLLGHLVGVVRRVTVMGRGENPMAVETELHDIADDAWLPTWLAAVDEATGAWADDAALTRTVVLPWATDTGAAALLGYVSEITVHTWDVAQATGQQPAWDDDAVGHALELMRTWLPGEGRAEIFAAVRDQMGMDPSTPDAFAAVVPVPDDAPLIDRLVAWNGRRP